MIFVLRKRAKGEPISVRETSFARPAHMITIITRAVCETCFVIKANNSTKFILSDFND